MIIKKAVALILAAAMLFSFSACKTHRAKNADKTMNYNLASEPSTLDPQIAADTSSVITIQALFEGLARLDSKENPIPGVAESWEHNSDNTQFTFHLRSNAKWSDKKYGSVTAADFVFSFQRALDPKTGSSTSTQMYMIKNARQIHAGKLPTSQLGVTAKDAKTLVVDLEYSCPDFPKLTASPVYMPCNQNFFNYTSGRYGLESKYLLGNGPFCIDGAYGWEHGKYLNLARSDTYSGKSIPLPSAVDFSIGSSSVNLSDPVAILKNQSVDAAPISSSQIDAAKAIGCTFTSFQDTTWGLCFNTQSSVFKNRKARSAFLQALNRSAVLSHIPTGSSAAENIILPETTLDGHLYRSLAGGPFYLKQSAQASQTLSSGLKELNLSSMDSVTVYCPDDANIKLMLNEMIASWNKQFNNYFNMKPLSNDDLQSRMQSGDYSIIICSVKPASDGPLAFLSQFTSNSSNNPAMWKDSTYDSLVASAQTKSGKDAATLYAAAEKRLNEQAVFYPLYYEKSYYALAKGVTGIIFHPYQGGADFINAGKE